MDYETTDYECPHLSVREHRSHGRVRAVVCADPDCDRVLRGRRPNATRSARRTDFGVKIDLDNWGSRFVDSMIEVKRIASEHERAFVMAVFGA